MFLMGTQPHTRFETRLFSKFLIGIEQIAVLNKTDTDPEDYKR